MLYMEEIVFPQLLKTKKLRIYVPNNYVQTTKRYPVIYMHDGQNLFDPSLSISNEDWQVHKICKMHNFECIVVGIDHADEARWDEYSPWKCEVKVEGKRLEKGGQGAKYAQFLVEQVKPHIDRTFRTMPQREYTAIIGSSMGGVISLYTGLTYPEIFSTVGALSTASWTARNAMMLFLEKQNPTYMQKIYTSVGTDEGHFDKIPDLDTQYVSDFHEITRILKMKGIDVFDEVYEGAKHNEVYWREPFKRFVQYFIK